MTVNIELIESLVQVFLLFPSQQMHLQKKKGSSVGKTNFFLRKLHCSRVYMLFCCFCCNVVHTLLVCLKCLWFLWFIRVLVLSCFYFHVTSKKMAVFGSSLLRKRKQGGVVSHHDSLDSNQSQSSSRVPWRRFGWIHTEKGIRGIQKGGIWVDLLLCLMMLFSPCKGRDGHTNIFKRLQMNL